MIHDPSGPSAHRGSHFGIFLVDTKTSAHDRSADALLAHDVVVVTGVVDFDNLAVNDAHDCVAVRTAAADLEAASDQRDADLYTANVLVLDLVREDLGPRIELLRSGRYARAGLHRLGVHAENHLAALHRNVMTRRRAGANRKQDKRAQQNQHSARHAKLLELEGVGRSGPGDPRSGGRGLRHRARLGAPDFGDDPLGEGIEAQVEDVVGQRPADQELHGKVVEALGVFAIVGVLRSAPALREMSRMERQTSL
jgi:hypothetical protein